jgi:hypothetical protein
MANFASSRGQKDVLEIREFLEWLGSHGHNELRGLIVQNHATTISIKASLAEGKDELLERLSKIEKMLGALTVGQGAIEDLAMSLLPDSRLSAQGVEILIAYEQAEAGKALEMHTLGGTSLFFLDGRSNGGYQPSDSRFFETDLDELVEMRLLSISRNGKGGRVLHLTRKGADIGQRMSVLKVPG